MRTLAQRVDAAIKASGKKGAAVAREVGTSEENLSKIRSGENDNPHYQLLVKIAQATGTTVAALAGESIQISPGDLTALLAFRDWIDSKLATIDARTERNAEILPASSLSEPVKRIADREPMLIVRAIGDSMRDAGILSGDILYATKRQRSATDSALGKIIVCRIGEEVFVKRLTSERRQHFLLSAHPRYRPIAIAPEDPAFTILGVVVRRMGDLE